ncbi:hypothetical protein ACJJTC_010577 [Scirpophaga incertulas]
MLKSHYRGITEDHLPAKRKYFNPTPGFDRPKPGTSQKYSRTATLVDPGMRVKMQQWLEDIKKYYRTPSAGLENRYYGVMEPCYGTYELFPSFDLCTSSQYIYDWNDYYFASTWPYYCYYDPNYNCYYYC